MALLRAAEKAGDSLVAGEAALKIGMDIPEMSDAQRIAWRYRAATLYEERAAADAEAIGAFEAVLELAPRFRPAFAGLARAHRRMRNWAALADVLQRRASCEASMSRAATLEVEASLIHAERLLAPDAALAALERALAFEPGNLSALDFRWGREVPTLFIVADRDTLLPLAGMHELLERTPAAKRMIVIKNADHMHFCDRVEEVHELFRLMPVDPVFAPLQPAVPPITELCPGEHSQATIRGLGLAHMDAHLRGVEAAARFLAGDVRATLGARGIAVDVI